MDRMIYSFKSLLFDLGPLILIKVCCGWRDVVGKLAPKKPQQFSNNPEIMSLSSERKAINEENCKVKGPSQRKRRNYLKRSIKKRLMFLRGATADALANQINNADDCSVLTHV